MTYGDGVDKYGLGIAHHLKISPTVWHSLSAVVLVPISRMEG